MKDHAPYIIHDILCDFSNFDIVNIVSSSAKLHNLAALIFCRHREYQTNAFLRGETTGLIVFVSRSAYFKNIKPDVTLKVWFFKKIG